jgi:hypothetical protein
VSLAVIRVDGQASLLALSAPSKIRELKSKDSMRRYIVKNCNNTNIQK